MEIVLLTLSFLTFGVLLFLYFKKQGSNGLSVELRELIKKELYQNRDELSKNLRETRLEITQSMERLNEVLAKKAKEDREELRNTLKDFQEAFSKNVTAFNELQKQNFESINQKQDELVKSTELKLEKMRETVDEKLHKTLEERLGKSFEVVTQQLLKVQKESGFDLLLNDSRKLIIGEDGFNLVGVENWGSGNFNKDGDLEKAMSNIDTNTPTILLSHDPSHWREVVLKSSHKIDLQLSGHTHGMQFGIEIPGFKWSPAQYRYKEWAGLYKKGESQIYVNRGLGHLGYAGRVGIVPDISILTIKRTT